jgi:hypothetical protein
MTQIFEVQDTTVEIEKFLLIEQVRTENTQDTKIVYIENGELKLTSSPSDISTGIKVFDSSRVYYNTETKSFVNKDGQTLTSETTPVKPTTSYIFDEENYKLYTLSGSTLTEKTFTFTDTAPLSLALDTIVYDELNEVFYTGITPAAITSITRVSIIDTLPVVVAEGSIYYVSSEDKFYIKTENGWSQLKVSSYYPEIIKDNIDEDIEDDTELGRNLSVYDGKYFTEVINSVRKLYRYVYSSIGIVVNETIDENFTEVISLPKIPGVIDVPFYRLFIKQGLMERADLNRSPMIYQSTNFGDVFRDFRSLINEQIGYSNITKENAISLTILNKINIENSDIKFVKVPYISDNGTREIQANIGSAVNYVRFLERNDTEKYDIYWTKENVPEDTLKELGLDTVETKYLALTISENIYRRLAITRYLLASIEYLEETFIVDSNRNGSISDESPILKRLVLDSGASLFGEATFYDFFQAIKILFKTVLKLQQLRYDDTSLVTISSTFNNYFGINAN